MPKWKTDEFDPAKGVKWQDVISYAGHVFRPWARKIGRCLQLVIGELSENNLGIGFQRLLGVRDQARAFHRLQGQMGLDEGTPSERVAATPRQNDLCEMDMDDMFWEIPTQEVFQSLEWALGEIKGRRDHLWFSIAKGGLRERDRLGRASSKDYDIFEDEEVTRYVTYDVRSCNLFTLGPLVLRQGAKGVPIGGYLSAQLAEIWAM